MVYAGRTESTVNSGHYGARDPNTGHIHIDTLTLAATPGSNLGWQLANTVLHEALHDIGFLHVKGLKASAYRGGTPIYDAYDAPFNDLNPGPNSCMKP